MKKFLDWLRSRRTPDNEKAGDGDARRPRDQAMLQRLAKLTKTANLPGLDDGPKKKED